MKENYDFSDAIKNPFAGKLNKQGYTVIVHYSSKDIADIDGSLKSELAPYEMEKDDHHDRDDVSPQIAHGG